jgi:glutamyl-Q tRNA(Asp) synthetase
VVNALYVWGMARAVNGRVLLRIEDHDRRRSRPEFEAAILDDLDWLGFVPDHPSTDAFRRGPCSGRQSDRTAIYEDALNGLRRRGLVYACECSRRDIAQGDAELRYQGTCADKNLAEGSGRALRIRLEPVVETFVDLRHGPQAQCPAQQCGDLLARDRDGNWSYQFAATVDDFEQAVTVVIRGDDLLPSTGRQIQLARLLGRAKPPRFYHHPLVMKSAGQKLSKADHDTSIRSLREQGLPAGEVIARASKFVQDDWRAKR